MVRALALGAWLVSSPASALTIFDFDDIPPAPMPLTGAPATYLYGCDGKPYCTDAELYNLGLRTFPTLTTTRDGLTITVYNEPDAGLLPNYVSPAGRLSTCNGPGAYDDACMFHVAGFSLPLDSAQVDLSGRFGVPPSPGLYAYFIEGYDGPEASGTLLGRAAIDMFGKDAATIAVSASGIRSIRFGSIGIPGGDCTWCGNSAEADNITVQPVPEPSSGLLLVLAASTLALCSRVRAT